MSHHYSPKEFFSIFLNRAEAVTSQENTSWNKAMSVLCLTLFLHCRAGKGLQGGWSPKPPQTTAGPSLGHSSTRLQGPCACGQKENLHSPAAPPHWSVCHLSAEIFCWLLHSGLHTSHTLPIELSWLADKWSNRKGSVYTYFYIFTSHHHCLQNLGLSVQGIKLQRHNYWTSCCSGERITVPQLLWHLITSINILIYHKQDSLVGQQMFRIIKGSWAWKECSVIKRHIWLYSQSEKEEPRLRGDHVFCLQAQGSFRYNILAEKVTI